MAETLGLTLKWEEGEIEFANQYRIILFLNFHKGRLNQATVTFMFMDERGGWVSNRFAALASLASLLGQKLTYFTDSIA